MQPTAQRAGGSVRLPRAAAWWIAVPGLIWGASFLLIAEGMRSIAPCGLTFLRILVGWLTLSLFPAARKPVLRSDRAGIVGLGILWLAFPLTLFPFAERHVTSALTGMLNGANPLFTAVVASIVARRRPSVGVLAGIGTGMAGALCMAISGNETGPSTAAGVGLIVAALVSYGVALNLASPLQRRNGALPLLWRAQMVALVLTAPLGLPDVLRAHWSFWSLLAVLALGSLGTAAAHVLLSVAAGRFGATRASATTFLIPAVALALGVGVRHEAVSLTAVFGGGLSLAGAWLMRRAKDSENRPDGGRVDRFNRATLPDGSGLEACKQGG